MNHPNVSSIQPQQQHIQSASFHLVLNKFKSTLSDEERRQFQETSLKDLHISIERIQRKQSSDKRLRGMNRLGSFLEGMKEYDKVITVFVNTSEILAFVWGPMKVILQAASTFSEAFDVLLDSYQRIGEHMPLLSQYEFLSQAQPHMARVLTLIYEDILNFHWKAIRYFKQKMWKQLFHALWRTFNSEFAGILRNLREHKSLLESQANIMQLTELLRIQETEKSVLEKSIANENDRRREIVYQWLSAAKTELDHDKFKSVRQAYPGTGTWLLNDQKFHAWFDHFNSTRLLWLNGIPGAGKTTLASLVIEEARKIQVPVAFFYCKYQDNERNSFVAVACGLLSQLLNQDEALLPYLYEHSSKSGQTTLSTATLAKELLGTALKNANRVYLVIDGIDECDRSERQDMVKFLEDVAESFADGDTESMRCLFVSQDDSAARRDFANITSLKVSEGDIRGDIRSFAREWSLKIKCKFDLSSEKQIFIEDVITDRAEGMFLYARLMCSYLYDHATLRQLEENLIPVYFPSGSSRLDGVYSKILERLFTGNGTQNHDDVKRLLCWLVCARRPLKWREIQSAVSFDIENFTFDWSGGHFRVDSKELCGSLVEIHSDETVELVHHTARRYLSESALSEIKAQEEFQLTLRCIGYLSLPNFDKHIEADDILDDVASGVYGFADYAFAYWVRHLERSTAGILSKENAKELAESLSLFIEMHWSEPILKRPLPKSTVERLSMFRAESNFNNIAYAVQVARRNLITLGKVSADEQVLNLITTFDRIRTSVEELFGNLQATQKMNGFTTVHHERFQLMYGTSIYKCPYVSCTRFYNGFSSANLRNDHILKHERSYFCSFPSCPFATIGYATLKELQKHENDSHGTFDSDDEFPEAPPEKILFDCTVCGRSFTRKHNLNIHMRSHGGSTEKRFICNTCGKGFARQGDLGRHQSSLHGDKKSFTCGGFLRNGTEWGCGRTFNRTDILARHHKSEKGRNCRLPLEEEEAEEVETSLSSSLN